MGHRIQGKDGVLVPSPDGSLGFALNTSRRAVGYMGDGIADPGIIGNGGR